MGWACEYFWNIRGNRISWNLKYPRKGFQENFNKSIELKDIMVCRYEKLTISYNLNLEQQLHTMREQQLHLDRRDGKQ